MKKIFVLIAAFMLAAGSLLAQNQIIDSVLFIAEGTTSIKSQAYYGKTNFNKVVIPESVKKIGSLAFHSCSKLKEVEIPASVDTIGNAAFQNCTSLTNVILHDGLKNLSYRLFKNTAISEITIPASVTEFGNEIFSSCDSLTTIRVDKYSEAHAFYNTDTRMQLTENEPAQTKEQWLATAKYNILDNGVLYISSSVKKINDKQYDNNESITEIRFSETLEKIGTYAFRKNTGLKKVVIPGNVKVVSEGAFSGCSNLEEVIIEEGVEEIHVYAFYNCLKLNSVTLPKYVTKLNPDGLYWNNKDTRVFHCYAGNESYNLAQKNNYLIDIIDIDEQYADSITELNFSGNTVISRMSVECPNIQTIKLGFNVEKIAAEGLRKCPVVSIDLNNNLTEIGENAFNDNTKLRIKRGTYADEWAKANGYYLCGVLADLNVYTKDKSKKIEEDFTRILCDDDSYANWTSYKFQVQQPLKIEEVDDKIVLTSFLLEPCGNVTVSQNGKAIISNKTIQPLTRTVLCEADGTTSPDDFSVSSDDSLYQVLTNLAIDWTIKFNGGTIRKTATATETNPLYPMYPVDCREWIATICNYAYVIASSEYRELCFKGVEEKWFVTDEAQTQFLTKEQMDALLEKAYVHSFKLGRCGGGGLGTVNGSSIWLLDIWYRNLGSKEPHGFFHEFSHNMGWNHNDGNMCNLGAGNGFGEKCWPMMGATIFKQFFAAGELPYNDKNLFNSACFSYEELHKPDPAEDVITDSVLHITEGVPCVTSHKNQTDFTKVVIPESVEVISSSAFYGTKITEVEIPLSVKRIENQAFQECKDLKSVVIADGVRKIGDNAFKSCAIDTIRIPSSVTELGSSITSKNVVWVVERGSAAYYNALENNYPIVLLPESEEAVTAQIIAESASAELASTSGWQTDDFAKTYARYRWDFSGELKGAGNYTVTFKYTGGSCMLCLSDALFVADGKAIAHFFERRTAGYNPSKIVYEITVPAGTEKMELLALAKTDGGTESKGAVKVEYLGGGEEQGNENQGGNENHGNENQGGNENQEEENQNENNNENEGGNNNETNPQTSITEQIANINIYAHNRTIIVENAPTEIRIYDVMGRLVGRDATPCVRAELRMDGAGIYVVKVGNLAKRVIVE
jgi:hypothetical protein